RPLRRVPPVLRAVRDARDGADRRGARAARQRTEEAAVTGLELDWRFAEPGRVHFVWAVIAVVGLLGVLELRSRGALAAFLSPVMQRRLTAQASGIRTGVKLGLVAMSLLA